MVAEQQTVRAYPAPFGINVAHVLGYLSPITEDELRRARPRTTTGRSTAPPSVGRAGVEKQYDEWLRGLPGYSRVAVDSMGRVLGDDGAVEARPATPWSPPSTPRCRASSSSSCAERIKAASAPTVDTVTGRNVRRRLRRRGRARGQDRPGRRDGQPADVRPRRVGRRHQHQRARAALLREGRHPAALAGDPGPVRPRLDVEAVHDRRRPAERLRHRRHAALLVGFQVGNRVFKNYESGAYGNIGFAKALEVSCNTFFYRIGYDYWQEFGSDVDDVDAKDPLVEEAKTFGFGSRTGIDLPGEATGRIADRQWKRDYYESMKDYYCGIAASRRTPRPATSSTGSPASSASRATPTAPATRSTSPSARATRSSRRCSSRGPTPRSSNGGTLCAAHGWPRPS